MRTYVRVIPDALPPYHYRRKLMQRRAAKERAAFREISHTHPPRQPYVGDWDYRVGDRVLVAWDHGTTKVGTITLIGDDGWLFVRLDAGAQISFGPDGFLDVHR